MSPYALFTAEEHERARHTVYAPGPKQKLDISLVIDTTGSMGDELAYLQRELDAITARIQRDYPSAEQRWSLVLYRDNGDAYTVRWFNFRADVADYRTKLAQQAAAGGATTQRPRIRRSTSRNVSSGDGTRRRRAWCSGSRTRRTTPRPRRASRRRYGRRGSRAFTSIPWRRAGSTR